MPHLTSLADEPHRTGAIRSRQTALLEKIELSALEQSILDNKRKRDAEVTLMNTTIRQWRSARRW